MERQIAEPGNLTHREKILVAMLRAGSGRLDPIRYEEIVVEAWRLFPDSFALPGYPQYPDGSNIHKPLYNTLKAAGLVAPAGQKRFALTEEGRRVARRVLEGVGNSTSQPPGTGSIAPGEDAG